MTRVVHHIDGDPLNNDPEVKRAPMRVGQFYVEEDGTARSVKLGFRKDGTEIAPLASVFVWDDGLGAVVQIPRRPQGITDPDLVECLSLALDRAAAILREAR